MTAVSDTPPLARQPADDAGLARLAWRRFHAIDGFNLSLLVTFNVFLTLLPLLIVAFAYIDVLVGGRGSFAKFLIRRLFLDPKTAQYVRMLIAPSERSRAGATFVGVASFALFGGSLVTQVQAAYDRAWNPRVLTESSTVRGYLWLLAAGVFNFALMVPVSVTNRALVPVPMMVLATFVQSFGFFWWTGRFLSARRRPWTTYLPGALWCGTVFAAIVLLANPVFGPILDSYHAAFGPFGSTVVICALLFLTCVGMIVAPCVSAAFWEWRGAPREILVVPTRRERRALSGDSSTVALSSDGDLAAAEAEAVNLAAAEAEAVDLVPEAPPELPETRHGIRPHIRYAPYRLQRKVESLRARAERSAWTAIPLDTYARFKESDGQNLSSAVALAGLIAGVPAVITAIALVDALVHGEHTFATLLVRLLALRGETIDRFVQGMVPRATVSRGWVGLALLTAIPFAPLLLTNAERLMNRPWAPNDSDRRNLRRSLVWGVAAAVLALLMAMPMVFGRATGVPWVGLAVRSALFLTMSCAVLTHRRRSWRDHVLGVVIGTVLAVAVTSMGGKVMGTWVEWYFELFGRIGIVMVFVTWAWIACVAWAVVPDLNAAAAAWRARRSSVENPVADASADGSGPIPAQP